MDGHFFFLLMGFWAIFYYQSKQNWSRCVIADSKQVPLAPLGQLPGLLTQPALAGSGSLCELQQRIYWPSLVLVVGKLETSSDQLQLATN